MRRVITHKDLGERLMSLKSACACIALLFPLANAQALDCTNTTARTDTPSIQAGAGVDNKIRVYVKTPDGSETVASFSAMYTPKDYSGPGPILTGYGSGAAAGQEHLVYVDAPTTKFKAGSSHTYVGTVAIEGCSIAIPGEVNIDFAG